jgi:bifunctional UDP-N-acetylglucosamine pyrophosphorylase/glucosamine-1-phosphate N-acetyltransferase
MKLAGVILAAGLGKRMSSSLPKVLHKIYDAPMLQYVLNTLNELKPQRIVVVVGKHFKEIRESVRSNGSICFAHQREAMGTGDALLKARHALRGFKGTVLIINGDTPLVFRETLKKFLRLHKQKRNVISVLSFMAEEPSSYGRVIKDESGRAVSIVEDRDATNLQKNIKEVNSGIYALESDAFHILKEIKLNESKGEYYLTDVISIANDRGIKVNAFCIGSENELMGVNTPGELEKVRQLMKDRIINRWINRGVNFMDTRSAFISPDVRIGKGTQIYPNVYLEGNTKVGKGCLIYPNVRIYDSIIGDEAIIKDSTLIEGSVVKKRASVGPFARIRPGSQIGEDAKIGNFVEVKKSVIGTGSKAQHLTYLGDSKIGNNVNIGAGTITCNYDGYKKHITVIKDNVFVGSDSQFIAPVKVGKGAYIGAGSTITEDVPSMALALSRIKQSNIKDWVIRRKLKVKSEKLKVKGAKSEGLRAKSGK